MGDQTTSGLKSHNTKAPIVNFSVDHLDEFKVNGLRILNSTDYTNIENQILAIPAGPQGPIGPASTVPGPRGIQGPPGAGSEGPLPAISQIVVVRQGGNDLTGDGTLDFPYLTITHAMATITDALYEKRYMIDVGPGIYTDNFSWKAWVFLRGSVIQATKLSGTIDINDPSWAILGTHSDERSGAEDISFTGTVTLNFTSAPSLYGKFYFENCNMDNALVMTAQGPVNQVIIINGLWFGGITSNGGTILTQGLSLQSGAITLNSSSTSLNYGAYGGANNGNLVVSFTTGVAVTAALYDSPVLGTVSVTGASAILQTTSSSLPIKANVTVSGGGSIQLLSDAFGLGYTPTTSANWGITPPTQTQAALDQLAPMILMSTIKPVSLASYPLSFAQLTTVPLSFAVPGTLPSWLTFPAGVMTLAPGSYLVNLNVQLTNTAILFLRCTFNAVNFDTAENGTNVMPGVADSRSIINTIFSPISSSLVVAVRGTHIAAANLSIDGGGFNIVKLA